MVNTLYQRLHSVQTYPHLRHTLQALSLLALILGVWVALSRTPLPVDHIVLGDKILHTSAFFAFSALFHLAWQRSFWLFVFVPLLSYGALIELLQGMTTWRSMEWADIVADAAGILLYGALYSLFKQYRPLHPQSSA